MKSTFSRFSSFWVRLRTIFRWLAPVFPRSTIYFLSHSPILNPNSRDFSRARHSFQPRTSIFPRFVLYFPILRALLRKISPFIIATLLFLHSLKAFSFHTSLSLPSSPPSYFQRQSFRPTITPPSSLPPQFPSLSSPLFHLPSQLTHERAHSRAIRAYAYARTSPHVRRFSFIAFTASPPLAIRCAPTR